MDGQSSRNHPSYAVCFPHVPSVSLMDLSPPFMEQGDAPSNMDAPSAPTHNMTGFVSEITPRKMWLNICSASFGGRKDKS